MRRFGTGTSGLKSLTPVGLATGVGADADGRRQQEADGRRADDECGVAAAGTTRRRGGSETDRATAMNDDAPRSSEMQSADRGRKRRRRRNGEAVSTRRRTHTVAAWTRGAYQQMHETLTIDLTMEDDDYVEVINISDTKNPNCVSSISD